MLDDDDDDDDTDDDDDDDDDDTFSIQGNPVQRVITINCRRAHVDKVPPDEAGIPRIVGENKNKATTTTTTTTMMMMMIWQGLPTQFLVSEKVNAADRSGHAGS